MSGLASEDKDISAEFFFRVKCSGPFDMTRKSVALGLNKVVFYAAWRDSSSDRKSGTFLKHTFRCSDTDTKNESAEKSDRILLQMFHRQ